MGLIAATAAPAWAQSGPNTLSVFTGVTLTEPDGDDPDALRLLAGAGPFDEFTTFRAMLDGSAEIGIRYSRAVTDALALEGDVAFAPGHTLRERVHYSCPEPELCLVPPDRVATGDVNVTHYGGHLAVTIAPGATLRPVLLAGAGGATFSDDAGRENRFALRIGGGVRTDLGRLDVRLEALDVVVLDHVTTGRAAHDVRVRLGAGIRW